MMLSSWTFMDIQLDTPDNPQIMIKYVSDTECINIFIN